MLKISSLLFSGIFTRYSGGGYVGKFGRTRENSQMVMDYLVRKNWFDSFTKAVFVEFNLFNPNKNLLSNVVILIERTFFDIFSVQPMVSNIST